MNIIAAIKRHYAKKYAAVGLFLVFFVIFPVMCDANTEPHIGITKPMSASAPTTGSFNFNFYNSGENQWMTVITSTFNKFTDCTITWNGVNTAGQHIGSSKGFVLPPYYGAGAAITSKYQFSDLTTFSSQAICKPRD
jgi:hypothetical protein